MAEGPSLTATRKLSKTVEDPEEEEKVQMDEQNHEAVIPDSNSLIQQLGRDISISCLLRLSRSEYGSVALLNKSFRSLIRSGELYNLRRKLGIIEHWVYFSCNILEWAAFDPSRDRWIDLPRMTSNEVFLCSDKESLAVGTGILVFGKELSAPMVYEYSILTNSWSNGIHMNYPRFLFACASAGEIAIVAGGCDQTGKVLSVAEIYNSDTRTWESLPNMNKARKMCSGFFMDGKFYALGGISEDKQQRLACGEEFDFKTRKWRLIRGLFPGSGGEDDRTVMPATVDAPPLVAVVNNELYAADFARYVVMKYVKERKRWVTLGSLPEGISSMHGWGVAFRGCGERLIVIGGPSTHCGGMVDINSWIPDGGVPHWDLLARRPSGSFVYNCTVMGC